MSSYASLDDLKAYALNDNFPDNTTFLLKVANDMVANRIDMNFNPNNERHQAAAKNAVCAQVLFWIETGMTPVGAGSSSSFSLGDLSMSGISDDKGLSSPSSLCNLSLSYLRRECLTYLGVGGMNRGPQII